METRKRKGMFSVGRKQMQVTKEELYNVWGNYFHGSGVLFSVSVCVCVC